jgi:hypothetical protein
MEVAVEANLKTLSSDDRATIFSSILATLTYCGAIVLVCVALSAVGEKSMDGSVAQIHAIPNVSTGMPL